MEEGVVNSILRSPLGGLFNTALQITDVSGSGNNWAVGHNFYGPKHAEKIIESLRHAAESCDCLQCFFVLHSLGGGTGSGIGCYITELLADHYPDVFKILTAVFPSLDDDVITSPYNTVLALDKITEHSDCVVSVENRALASLVNKINAGIGFNYPKGKVPTGSIISGEGGLGDGNRKKAFDEMNNIVANMLLNLTSSARFAGSMNVDLNELSTNLVPFPRLQYLISAQSPITSNKATTAPRNIDQLFQDVYSNEYQLISTIPKKHTFLATSLLIRGAAHSSDLRRNVEKLQVKLKFVPWNRQGWKVGHCEVPPVGQGTGLLALSNNTSIVTPLADVSQRFNKLFKKRAHIHHYLNVDGFEMSDFNESASGLTDLIAGYTFFDSQTADMTINQLPKFKIAD